MDPILREFQHLQMSKDNGTRRWSRKALSLFIQRIMPFLLFTLGLELLVSLAEARLLRESSLLLAIDGDNSAWADVDGFTSSCCCGSHT